MKKTKNLNNLNKNYFDFKKEEQRLFRFLLRCYGEYVKYKGEEIINPIIIGAHRGLEEIPLLNYVLKNKCKSLLVEPDWENFSFLEKQFDSKLFLLENCAIDTINGERNIYYLPDSDAFPVWSNQLCSFYEEHILKHEKFIPNIKEHIVKTKVKTMTFASLIEKHDITKCDIVQIDTEGHDYEILKQIPFCNLGIKIVCFESRHTNLLDCIELMKKHNYTIVLESDGVNITCYDPGFFYNNIMVDR